MQENRINISPSLKDYLEYKVSDDFFPIVLRVRMEWDDSNYQKMIGLINRILEEYKKEYFYPLDVILFFTNEISTILSIISHPLFGKTREDEYKLLVVKRKKELQDFQRDFFIGNFFEYDFLQYLNKNKSVTKRDNA
ncbi:hypothetical protein DXA26_14425 [Bacteroides fragilis]|jgi:hypothetical protein|nr:hypothetical protein [Bacteroides fragilis]RGY73211.1 hypothetical protein DXA26_14425 [Bacteroides fragilis]